MQVIHSDHSATKSPKLASHDNKFSQGSPQGEVHRSQLQRQSAAQDVISCSGQWLFGMLYFHMSPCYCVCVVHTLTAKPTKLCTKLWSTICTAGISPCITVSGELVFFKRYRGWETAKHSLPFARVAFGYATHLIGCAWERSEVSGGQSWNLLSFKRSAGLQFKVVPMPREVLHPVGKQWDQIMGEQIRVYVKMQGESWLPEVHFAQKPPITEPQFCYVEATLCSFYIIQILGQFLINSTIIKLCFIPDCEIWAHLWLLLHRKGGWGSWGLDCLTS